MLSADGLGTNEIMRLTDKSKTCVWRWQERFAQEGFDGLLRDKTRPSRLKPLGDEIAARIVALTLQDPPGEITHWTGALMARASGVSVSSVQRIWRAHGLQPHRVRQFKLSGDPNFIGKLRDVVGLYVDPPAHAIVLSVDGKSRIQALGRAQPGLPLNKGRAGTMTHDCKWHGTATLFAALNVLGGKVIHDLHHTFASMLVSGGMTLPMIGKLLGHTQVQTTQRYAHLFDDPLRAGLNQIGDMLRPKLRIVAAVAATGHAES